MNELILYTTEDGQSHIQLRADNGTVWLSQLEIAELFQTTKQNVSLHGKNIFEDGELNESTTVKESLTVQNADVANTTTEKSSVVQTPKFATQCVANLQNKRT